MDLADDESALLEFVFAVSDLLQALMDISTSKAAQISAADLVDLIILTFHFDFL